jgi:hypothetical protein
MFFLEGNASGFHPAQIPHALERSPVIAIDDALRCDREETRRRKVVSTEENKALVRRFYAELDNLNPAVIDELVADGFINHSPPPFLWGPDARA